MRLGRLVWLSICVSALTGCFYLDPINRSPAYASMERDCSAADPSLACDTMLQDLHRGDAVRLKALFTDPDSPLDRSTLQWQIRACDSTATMCDGRPLYDGSDSIAPFTVPQTLADFGTPVQVVAVKVKIIDDRGASTQGTVSLRVNDGPTLVLSRTARSYTVGAPITLFATYGDPDNGPPGAPPTGVALQWRLIPPDGLPPTLVDHPVLQNLADPGHVTAGEDLVPMAAGAWEVRVTATSHGFANEKALMFMVAPDQPPCLAQWEPIVPPDGAALPLIAPTVFQVPLVDDDLDPYPPVPGQPLLGSTTFLWSILLPGAATRQRLRDATGNSVDLDPSAFIPGQIVELRVEISDRKGGVVACPDGEPVCPLSSSPGCNQRQTWRVEIR